MNNKQKNLDEMEFSLVQGGPIYQFFLRIHLLKPALKLWKRRIIAISLFTWLPLLILALIEGTAIKGVNVPFLFDIETHVRFLAALALLIGSEVIVHKQIKIVVLQFLENNIISDKDKSRFKNIINSSMRLRNSIIIELLIIVSAFTLGHWIWTKYASLHIATWYAIPKSDNEMQLTLAGYWYVFVSLPIFQIILLRWFYRLFIWYRFLWQVSKLPLRLNALHPDQAGGLGFLTLSVFAFAPILLSNTLLYAGFMANQILYAGVTLFEFKVEVISLVTFMMLVVFLPLTFFVPALIRAKKTGLLDYEIVASQYVDDFHQKWLNPPSAKKAALLGTPDIQSLSDLSTSFGIVRKMRSIPFSKGVVLQLMVLIIIPFSPLVLTMIPLQKIVSQFIKLLI